MTQRIALLLLVTLPACAPAGEEHYILMFGAQRVPNNPEYSHSFATFVRISWPGDGPAPKDAKLEEVTVSWLAVSMKVRVLKLLAEPGHNFDLHDTIRWCQCNHMRVSLWGAYRCCPELYEWAVAQAQVLESGRVRWKSIDTGRSTERVANCIHAVADVVEGRRVRVASPGWGETASYAVLQRFDRFIDQDSGAVPWVGSALGLDAHPIIYRDWQSPRSGFFGPVYRLFGGERNLRETYGPPAP